jgi:CubicO group peptidase (beta-lactamase class C family)
MVKVVTADPSYCIHPELGIGQENWDEPEFLATGQTAMHELLKTVAIEAKPAPIDLKKAAHTFDLEKETYSDPLMPGRSLSGEQLLNRRVFNDALLVMHKGEVVHESYRNGMQSEDRHVIHSCTKSLCAMIVAIALQEGCLQASEQISHYIPEFQHRKEWVGVSVQHVLDMQAGIEYSEDYRDANAHYWRYARAAGYYPPLAGERAIGAKQWIFENLNTRICEPGTHFEYNSCLANVLGIALENVYKKNLAEIFEDKLYSRVGAESAGYFNTDPQGFPITEGQFNLRLKDFARCASLMLNGGKNLAGEQILPKDFVAATVSPNAHAQGAYQEPDKDSLFPNAQYRNQFWVFEPEKQQFTQLGIHGQFAWIDLKRDLMMVGNGSFPKQDGQLMMSALKTLWEETAVKLDKA